MHEATVDRNYTKGKKEAVDTMKGHQNLGYDNPQMAHHAKNNELLSDAYYKEEFEAEKAGVKIDISCDLNPDQKAYSIFLF